MSDNPSTPDGGDENGRSGSETSPSDNHLQPDVTLDALFELLSNERRRLVVSCLSESSDDAHPFSDIVD